MIPKTWIQKLAMLIAALSVMVLFAQAEQPKKTENSDTVEAIAEDATAVAKEENASDESNASEVITPIAEEKPKPSI